MRSAKPGNHLKLELWAAACLYEALISLFRWIAGIEESQKTDVHYRYGDSLLKVMKLLCCYKRCEGTITSISFTSDFKVCICLPDSCSVFVLC